MHNSKQNTNDTEDDKHEKKRIQNTIARLLSAREHSYLELVRKLSQKEFDTQLIAASLSEYVDKGLQSDQRYAESFTRTAYAKGKGPSVINQHLKQHQIDDAYINTCLKDTAFDWFEAANRVRIKRFGEALPKDWEAQQKQKRFLQYRGFYQEHIDEVFI